MWFGDGPQNIIVVNLEQTIAMNENGKVQHNLTAFIFVYLYTVDDSYTCMVRPHQKAGIWISLPISFLFQNININILPTFYHT